MECIRKNVNANMKLSERNRFSIHMPLVLLFYDDSLSQRSHMNIGLPIAVCTIDSLNITMECEMSIIKILIISISNGDEGYEMPVLIFWSRKKHQFHGHFKF